MLQQANDIGSDTHLSGEMTADSPTKRPAWWRIHGAGLTLLGLTIGAAVIRFFHLSTPCLWYDEARVYWRICGTYGQLLECLRTDGFGPLHYEADWVLAQSLWLPSIMAKWHWLSAIFPSLKTAHPASPFPGPVVLRFIPALSGTLMVPAMYFLARQLLPTRTALLAAAFTACSAFLIFYSRDAKMYMDTWLFVALGMGSLFWWIRTDSSTAWLCWIAATAAAAGIHATSLIAPALSLLFLLSQKKLRWQKFMLWLIGIVLIAAGPVGYYKMFNTWTDRVTEDWHFSELEWIKVYNFGRTGPELPRYLGTTMLIGWEWPGAIRFPDIPAVRTEVPIALCSLFSLIFLVAVFPWPPCWRGDRSIEPRPQARWRVLLWLSLWIVLPAYVFYCRSIQDFASPIDWLWALVSLLPDDLLQLLRDHQWPWVVLGLAAGAGVVTAGFLESSRSLLFRGLEVLAVFALVMVACWGVYAVCAPAARAAAAAGKPWESLWVPRYIGVIWPALALAIAALVLRLPTRPVRITTIVLLLGVNLFYGGNRIFGQTEPPVDQMATDFCAAEDPVNHTQTWINLYGATSAPGGGNLLGECGEYYLDSLQHPRTSPAEFKKSTRQLSSLASGWLSRPRQTLRPTDQHLIIWNQYNLTYPIENLDPTIKGWTLLTDHVDIIRDCWTRQDITRYRRREYVKNPANSL